jgi:hypothetical protein
VVTWRCDVSLRRHSGHRLTAGPLRGSGESAGTLMGLRPPCRTSPGFSESRGDPARHAQRRALPGILKSGWTTFSGNRDRKEDPFGATRALRKGLSNNWPSPSALPSFALRALGAARVAPK